MADTPFGASFGDPRKYMGSSGIGQAVKTGLTAYAVQKSGLADWLNSLSGKPTYAQVANAQNTTFVPGAVPLPDSFNQYLQKAPVAPPGANAQQSVAPVLPQGDPSSQTSQVLDQQPQPQPMQPNPSQIGSDWLNGNISSLDNFTNPQAQRDFNPQTQQAGYNQMLNTGREYENAPGYGHVKKMIQQMMSQMG